MMTVRIVFALWITAALWTSLPVFSQPTGEPAQLDASRAKLNRVVAKLKKEQDSLNEFKKNEQSLIDAVEKLDRQLEAGTQQRDKLLSDIQHKKELLTELEQRIQTQRKELTRRKRELGKHMRLVYGMGEQGILKLAFSRDNVHQARQGLRYFGYLVHSRQQEFAAFRVSLDSLTQSTTEHQAAVKALAALMVVLDEKQDALGKERHARNVILEKVKNDALLKQRQVEALQKTREQMSDFVSKLEEELASVLPAQQSFNKIIENKGKLPPPSTLPPRESDPGILYQGPENSPVHAIFRGQVVYADWFRGYGLLIILDHGDHVFSLYGHNHKLLVAQGDWVETMEKIAAVGDTGSVDGPGLYFEIRAKGRPDDPAKWLAKAGAALIETD